MKDWYKLSNKYVRSLFAQLGIYNTTDILQRIQDLGANPILFELDADPEAFIAIAEEAGNGKLNLIGVCQAFILAQMVILDRQGGIRSDGKPVAIRTHWYSYFKVFSQKFAFASGKVELNKVTGDMEMKDTDWSGRQSQILKKFVDSRRVTYKDLWVYDASRKIEIFGHENSLFKDIQIIVAVEKNSLHEEYINAAKAIGAVALVAGGGKMGAAGTEKMLRDLGWDGMDCEMAYRDTLVIHLSDYDYDGRQVIGPTFGTQAKRYLHYVAEERIGIEAFQVEAIHGEGTKATWDASYKIKMGHNGYQEWADNYALVRATCDYCHRETYVIGSEEGVPCPECGEDVLTVTVGDDKEPHGFEVEAIIDSKVYFRAMVDALLRHISWEDLLQALRYHAKPSKYSIISTIKSSILQNNPKYMKIRQAEQALQNARWDLEQQIETELDNYTEEQIEALTTEWAHCDPDPELDSIYYHVEREYEYPYQPFDTYRRQRVVVEAIRENTDFLTEVASIDIDDYASLVDNVRLTLEN